MQWNKIRAMAYGGMSLGFLVVALVMGAGAGNRWG